MHHVLNGDSLKTVFPFEENQIIWREILSEGPVTPDIIPRTREKFLRISSSEYEKKILLEQKKIMELAGDLTLWFEHDLVCQINLIYLLSRIKNVKKISSTSLVCIGRHPAVKNFRGLSQLSAPRLEALFRERRILTENAFLHAASVWEKYASDDPQSLGEFLFHETEELPFLRTAIIRHWERFPSVQNGLNQTEQKIIRLVHGGIRDRDKLNRLVLEADTGLGLTDLAVEAALNRLSPLFSGNPGGDLEVNEFAEKVLADDLDFLGLQPENFRLGGADALAFRWDRQGKTLVRV